MLQQVEATFGYGHNTRYRLPWVPCYWFNRGGCLYGASCTYLHTKPPNYGCYDSEGRIVCRHHQWYSRGCLDQNCQWSHDPAVPLRPDHRPPASPALQRSQDTTLDEQAIADSSFALVLSVFAATANVPSPTQLADTDLLRVLCESNDRTGSLLLQSFLFGRLSIDCALGEGNFRQAMLVRAPKQVENERHSHWPAGIQSEMPLVAVLVHDLALVRRSCGPRSQQLLRDLHPAYPQLPRTIAGCPLLVLSPEYMFDPQFISVRINRTDRPKPSFKRLLSVEHASVCNRTVPLDAIQAARRAFARPHHSNVLAVSCGPVSRFINDDHSPMEQKEAIIVYVLLKRLIPVGEQPLPSTFEHNGCTYRVKVCDGCYEPWSGFREKVGTSIAAVPQSLLLSPDRVGTDIRQQWKRGTLGALAFAEFEDGSQVDLAITNFHVVRPQVRDAQGSWIEESRDRVPIQSPCPKDASSERHEIEERIDGFEYDLTRNPQNTRARAGLERSQEALRVLDATISSADSYVMLGTGTLDLCGVSLVAPILAADSLTRGRTLFKAPAAQARRGIFGGFGIDVGGIELTAVGKQKVEAGYEQLNKRVSGTESLFDQTGALQPMPSHQRLFKSGSASGRSKVRACEKTLLTNSEPNQPLGETTGIPVAAWGGRIRSGRHTSAHAQYSVRH